MWALTDEAREEKEDEEAEDLVDFARGLDIDQYLGDLEVKVAMEVVKNRVKELKEKQKNDERARRAAAKKQNLEEERKARAAAFAASTGADASGFFFEQKATEDNYEAKEADEGKCGELEDASAEEGDAKFVAQTILRQEKGTGLGAIHSVKSLSSVVQRVKEEGEGATNTRESPFFIY